MSDRTLVDLLREAHEVTGLPYKYRGLLGMAADALEAGKKQSPGALWRFTYSRRGGRLIGLFVATQEEVDAHLGKTIYFGEVLGKHSDVEVVFDRGCVSRVEVDPAAVAMITDALGKTWCGWNPIKMIEEREAEETEADQDVDLEDDGA